jgi:hypothetical protein
MGSVNKKSPGTCTCACGATLCGCTGLPTTLHLTIPAAVATLIGTSTAITLNYPGILASGSPSWQSTCFTTSAFPPETLFSWILFCDSPPSGQFQLNAGTAVINCTHFSNPSTVFPITKIASPCGATFLWTFTVPSGTFAGTYTITN